MRRGAFDVVIETVFPVVVAGIEQVAIAEPESAEFRGAFAEADRFGHLEDQPRGERLLGKRVEPVHRLIVAAVGFVGGDAAARGVVHPVRIAAPQIAERFALKPDRFAAPRGPVAAFEGFKEIEIPLQPAVVGEHLFQPLPVAGDPEIRVFGPRRQRRVVGVVDQQRRGFAVEHRAIEVFQTGDAGKRLRGVLAEVDHETGVPEPDPFLVEPLVHIGGDGSAGAGQHMFPREFPRDIVEFDEAGFGIEDQFRKPGGRKGVCRHEYLQ